MEGMGTGGLVATDGTKERLTTGSSGPVTTGGPMEGMGTTGPVTTGGVKERLTTCEVTGGVKERLNTCAVGITAGAGTRPTGAIGITGGVEDRMTTTGGLKELLTTPVSGTIGAPRYAMLPANIIGSGS